MDRGGHMLLGCGCAREGMGRRAYALELCRPAGAAAAGTEGLKVCRQSPAAPAKTMPSSSSTHLGRPSPQEGAWVGVARAPCGRGASLVRGPPC